MFRDIAVTNIKGYYERGLKVQLAVFTPPLFDIVKLCHCRIVMVPPRAQ